MCLLFATLVCLSTVYECHEEWLSHLLTGTESECVCMCESIRRCLVDVFLEVWKVKPQRTWVWVFVLWTGTFISAPSLSESSGCFQSLVKGRFNKIQSSLFIRHVLCVCVGSTCSCPGVDVACVCPFLTLTGQYNFKACNITVPQ